MDGYRSFVGIIITEEQGHTDERLHEPKRGGNETALGMGLYKAWEWLSFCQLSIIDVPKAMKHQGCGYMNQLLLQTEITIRLQPINLKPIVS